MSKLELAILIIAISIPLLSLFLSLPIFNRRKNKAEPKTVSLQEFDTKDFTAEIPKPVTIDKETEDKIDKIFNDFKFDDDDFKSYLNEKAKNNSKPKELSFDEKLTKSLADFDVPFDLSMKPEKKSIAEQIQDLSPEMKALLISGVLNKKY